MATLQIVPRPVYFAPSANRCYLTKRAAAHAEASALVSAKYQRETNDNGWSIWWWGNDERLVRLHSRIKRRLMKRMIK